MNAYEKYFDGYDIYECVVGGGNLALIGREEDKPLSEVDKIKIIITDNDKPIGEDAGYMSLSKIQDVLGCLVTVPDPAYIFVTSNAQVIKSGYEGDIEVQKFEENIPGNTLLISNLTSINGKAYALGSSREVFRRDTVDTWTNIAKELSDARNTEITKIKNKYENEEEYLMAIASTASGMRGIDGFDEKDIYIVGRHGGCWHYNGDRWRRIDLPTNVILQTVCCAEDGYVYIGGMGEIVLKGRDEQWEIIQEKDSENVIRKIVDFKGKVYLSTFYNLFELSDGKISEVVFGEYKVNNFGYVGVNSRKTRLIAGGSMAAYSFDGNEWIELINIFGVSV